MVSVRKNTNTCLAQTYVQKQHFLTVEKLLDLLGESSTPISVHRIFAMIVAMGGSKTVSSKYIQQHKCFVAQMAK
jgi:hypothetical protein